MGDDVNTVVTKDVGIVKTFFTNVWNRVSTVFKAHKTEMLIAVGVGFVLARFI
jgi:hypothetical protein